MDWTHLLVLQCMLGHSGGELLYTVSVGDQLWSVIHLCSMLWCMSVENCDTPVYTAMVCRMEALDVATQSQSEDPIL